MLQVDTIENKQCLIAKKSLRSKPKSYSQGCTMTKNLTAITKFTCIQVCLNPPSISNISEL